MRTGDHLVGRYRLDAPLDYGGMGEVWRGYFVELGRAVALKLLLEFSTSDELFQRFRREASIGARLQHPGITTVYDIGRHDHRLFIVMELLQGADLAKILACSPGGLAVPEAAGLARQAAEALAAAHARQVVHRDIKPGNLFLLADGRLKICDFGIARAAEVTNGLTVTGRPIGTPLYMAPEQWRGEHVDGRCDLYALGCVLYALLTGAPPFPAAEPVWAMMRRHLEEVPPALRAMRGDVPAAVERLVAALLAKDPGDRPGIADVIATLTTVGTGSSAAGIPTPDGTLASTTVDEQWTAPVEETSAAIEPPNDAYVTPLVRKLAEEHGVDLATIRGTGFAGRIRKQDVLAAAGHLSPNDEQWTVPVEATSAAIEPLPYTYVTPLVRKLAEEHGVDLATVRGTGALGRVRQDDVLAAAGLLPPNDPYVTPLVRKLAEQHGVDLATVQGTGIAGRIRKQDVLAAAQTQDFPYGPN